MPLKNKPSLIVSLFITLNIANAAPPEELTKKPSSAIRIAHFRKQALKFGERARKFGRRLAGTKEYTSEEIEWARAKIFTVVVAGALITVGLYLKPFKSSLHSQDPKGGATPSPKRKGAKKKKKEDPNAPAGEGAPKDSGGGKREEGEDTPPRPPKSEWPGWTGAVINWWHLLPGKLVEDPHGARPELREVQTPD
ncbi:hypothetical protein E3J61_01930 [Candidatus Dependentiae bacterium]|nr:MAG: hypothetical protein E3J61_01930 [Candidatus Dependentiae bacterium]